MRELQKIFTSLASLNFAIICVTATFKATSISASNIVVQYDNSSLNYGFILKVCLRFSPVIGKDRNI